MVITASVVMVLLAPPLRVWGDFVRRFFVLGIIFFCCWLLIAPEALALEERLIAVIMTDSHPRYQDVHSAFAEALQPACGSDCRIYVQTPNADTMSLRNSVRKAVALGAELIITYGPSATLAAQSESLSTTTLFADVYDPVALNLVSADKMTGHNMTGVRGDAPLQALLKYFLEATKANSIAVLYDDASPEANLQRIILQDHGAKRGADVMLLPVVDLKDHDAALQSMPEGVDGLFLANSEHSEAYLERVIGFADERQIPVFTQRAGAAEVGAFMVLQTSAVEQGEKVAEMAEAILAGKKVEEIKMYKPRKVEFVVNLKVANRYNINIPFQTLSVASRVVR
jgi:putative ABC transport system substrate-binding protein